METNAQLTAVNPSENIVNIANYIQENISGRKAGVELIEWVKNNLDKVSDLGWNTYNGFSIDRKKEDQFDALLDIIVPLKLY